jgi:hypothetical protein
VYAIASLADDWPEQQQACIDVLCSYLQMPWLDDAPAAYLAERHVRRAVVQSIGRRLGSAGVGWSSRDFDFSDARLVDIRFENCHFGGQVSFARAVFEGNCLLAGLTFERGAAFAASEVAGTLTLDRLQTVHPAGLSFEGAVVDVGAELRVVAGVSEADRGRHPRLDRLIVRGLLSVQLPASQVVQPPLSLDWVDVEGGRVRMDVPLRVTKNRAVAHRPRVHARDWVLKDGCEIDIPQKLIDDDVVSFGSVLRPMEIPATATLTFRIAGDDRAD